MVYSLKIIIFHKPMNEHMNNTIKLFLVIGLVAINVLSFDSHQNFSLHIFQLIIEVLGLSFFSYFLIHMESYPHADKLRLLIAAFLVVILKNISLVMIKFTDRYFPELDESFSTYLFIAILLFYSFTVFFGIERVKKKAVNTN